MAFLCSPSVISMLTKRCVMYHVKDPLIFVSEIFGDPVYMTVYCVCV